MDNKQVMKKSHLYYLNKKVDEYSLKNITSNYYKNIIIERGNWLLALITQKIKPISEAQKSFLIEFKKLSLIDSDFKSLNTNIKALTLWKGEEKIKGISMNLAYGKKNDEIKSYKLSRKKIFSFKKNNYS